ncbi:hypothetical protein RHGRI_030957 [Rhododendron griersonianum]|uniref:Cytokinin riboside 5'-monophosphate phosphoribohydrolase n=1 Tax=Rhododendron griersonianum TaxID=479676 RepID=A0AAV6I8M6_9ERIC|nr:hypothetical protein RHGRI_030957 [Rhododendron griersonianum]
MPTITVNDDRRPPHCTTKIQLQSYTSSALKIVVVERKIDLVYGGGSFRLMGLISQRVYDRRCHVLGVIPKALVPLEPLLHERKAEMAREADAFIDLPGGYGTVEEVLEMITWSQLGIHKKPVGLLNVDGYYNSCLHYLTMVLKKDWLCVENAAKAAVVITKSLLMLLYYDGAFSFNKNLLDAWKRMVSTFKTVYEAVGADSRFEA